MITIIIIILIIMGLFTFFKKIQGPVYDPADAINVIYEALPDNIKSSLSKEDVGYILDLEFQYQQKVGFVGDGPALTEPVQMDEKLNEFISGEATKTGKSYSNDIINQVLVAEEVYLKKIGAIKE